MSQSMVTLADGAEVTFVGRSCGLPPGGTGQATQGPTLWVRLSSGEGPWLRADHDLGNSSRRAANEAFCLTWTELVELLDSGPEHARAGGAE